MAVDVQTNMGIAELARRAGVTPRTVRYYVAEGLLPPARGQGQHRAYGPEHLRQLETIRHLKKAYLPLHEIRRRLGTVGSRGTDRANEVATTGPTTSAVATDAPASSSRLAISSTAGSGTLRAPVPNAGPDRLAAVVIGSTNAPDRADTRPTLGFGGAPHLGRIEIFEDVETSWRRVILAPGVELHYRERDDAPFIEAIKRLVREAPGILDQASARPRERRSDNEAE